MSGPRPIGFRLEDAPGRFAIHFPPDVQNPERSVEQVRSPGGTIQVVLYTTRSPRGTYSVTYNDYPALAIRKLSDTQVLSRGGDAVLRGATLEREQDLPRAGSPGRRLWFTKLVQGQTVHNRVEVVFARPRLYQIHFATSRAVAAQSPQVDAFFASFQLLGSPP